MPKMYSVIIPAYNEEEWLPKSLAALKEAMRSIDMAGEIIVTDNNSTDGTSLIAKEQGVRVVFEPVNQISRARNAGAKAARGRFLIFLDADTIIAPDLLKTALRNLSNGKRCGGGAAVCLDTTPGIIPRKILALWTFISIRFGVAAGSFIYCLREGFDAVGGFSEKVYASEEVWFSRDLKRWGRKMGLPFEVITEHPVITSSRKAEHPSRLLLTTLIILVFPFALRFRSLCALWYKGR